MPTQPLGWFQKPITRLEDFKGLRFRTVGLSVDVFQGMGAAVTALPGGEIVAAMDRKVIDAAEFNNASSDRILGFADVSKICMLQSYHQNAEQFEILFNKGRFDALPERMKAIISNAVEAASVGYVLEGDRPLFEGLHRAAAEGQGPVLQDAGCYPSAATPDLREVARAKAKDNPMFKEIVQVPARVRPAGGAMGVGHGCGPENGLQPLLRAEGKAPALTRHI